MKKETLPILASEQRDLFKKCLISLDPAIALSDTFIGSSFEMYKKTKTSKVAYMRLADTYRLIEGFVNLTGTQVVLLLKASHDLTAKKPRYNFNKRLVWNTKGNNNDKAIELYRTFKEMFCLVREEAEKVETERQYQRKVCISLMETLPDRNARKLPISIGTSWKHGYYTVQLLELTEDQAELITRTLKPII